MKTSLWNNFIT